jgi:hypothetical protein
MSTAELPYRGPADLTLSYADSPPAGAEFSYSDERVLISPTPSTGIVDVYLSRVAAVVLRRPGLNRARVRLPSGTQLVGEVSYINVSACRFVLVEDDRL